MKKLRMAVCYFSGAALEERMVREGWALDYRKYSTELTSSAIGGV